MYVVCFFLSYPFLLTYTKFVPLPLNRSNASGLLFREMIICSENTYTSVDFVLFVDRDQWGERGTPRCTVNVFENELNLKNRDNFVVSQAINPT